VAERAEWINSFFKKNQGVVFPIAKYCMAFPEECRVRNEISHEAITYALGNLSKLHATLGDISKGSFFIPVAIAGAGIAVYSFGLSREITITEQSILELLANEIATGIWATDQEVFSEFESVARRKLSGINVDVHDIRHLVEEQQLAIELLDIQETSTEQGAALEKVRGLSERIGARLLDLQQQLNTNSLNERMGSESFLNELMELMPSTLLPQLKIVCNWNSNITLEISGTGPELARAVAPLVTNSLIYGGLKRRKDPQKYRTDLDSLLNPLISRRGLKIFQEVDLEGISAVFYLGVLGDDDTIQENRMDDQILHLEIFDGEEWPTGEMLFAANVTAFGERLPSSKPTGGHGLLGSLEVLMRHYDATVQKVPGRGLLIQIPCKRCK
jgi:hypothetical protein